jgi:hypothetical protein
MTIQDRMADMEQAGLHATTSQELKEAGERPTGQEIFDSLSKAEQDEMLGPEAADMVRNGDAVLSDFVEVDGGFITQRPVTALEGKAAFVEEEHPRGPGGRFTEKPKRPDEVMSRREFRLLLRKIWKRLSKLLDAEGEPHPEIAFGGTHGYLGWSPWGGKVVRFSPDVLRRLKAGGRERDEALNTILHELAHSQQNIPAGTIIKPGTERWNEAEGGASWWAHSHAEKLYKSLGIAYRPYREVYYRAELAWVKRHRSRLWMERGQFKRL